MVSAGNGVRCLEKELKQAGIALSEEFEEAERELRITTLPDSHFGEGTKKIMTAADELGFKVEPMPKFIDSGKCKLDGRCAYGCPEDAKWSALNYVQEAERKGVRIITGMAVDEVVVNGGKVKGVKSNEKVFSSDLVVLSAGAMETPRLLKKGVTNRDATIISEGASIAGTILEEAGADPSTFVSTRLRGAHPGGTAKIGISVNKKLETEISGLSVADASVLPAAPGAPPVLTIVALAKYVSRIIAQ